MPYLRGTRYPLLYAPPIVVPSGSYIDTVLATSPLAYWPLDEASGTTADNAEGTAARDITYQNGVSLANDNTGAFGTVAPLFDGSDDYVGSLSVLGADFDGQEFTISVWAKTNSPGTLPTIIRIRKDSSNDLFIRLDNTTLQFGYIAGGTFKQISTSHGITATNWHHYAMTVSLTSDQFIAYVDAVQFGTTQTGLGTWVNGSVNNVNSNIGAYNNASSGVFSGWIAHPAIWTSALSGSAITTLANP